MWVSEDVCYIGATVGVSLWRKKCLRARINCGIKVSPHGSRLTGSISADFGGRHCQDLDALPDTRVFLQANVLLSEKIGWDDLFPYGLHAFSQPPPPHQVLFHILGQGQAADKCCKQHFLLHEKSEWRRRRRIESEFSYFNYQLVSQLLESFLN